MRADWKGAGLVIPVKGGRFLWAVSAPAHWRKIKGRLYIDYSGVGGGVEPGESFADAALRECKEETGREAELLSSTKTYVIDEVRDDMKIVKGFEEMSPLIIERKRLLGGKTLLSYSYVASIRGTPKPRREVPALLYTSQSEILRQSTPTVSEIINDGAKLIEAKRIPRTASIRRWGTTEYLHRLAVKKLIDLNSLSRSE